MPPPKDKPNPVAAPGDDFTRTIHSDAYPEISSIKANLEGKSVFIVGGNKNIGRSITLSFAKAGASAIGVGARSDQPSLSNDIKTAAEEAGKVPPQVLITRLDVKDENSVKEASEKVEREFGKLDILVFNSGTLSWGLIAESDPAVWWNDFETNIRGPYLAARVFLPLLEKSQGQLVITTSVGAFLSNPGLSSYQISKLAVLRFTEFIESEYGSKGVLCFSIHPGNVPGTDIIPGGVPEDIKHVFTETPELCADSIVFLTQEKREWLNGRYISATWDMPELLAKKDEIVQGNKLKMRLAL